MPGSRYDIVPRVHEVDTTSELALNFSQLHHALLHLLVQLRSINTQMHRMSMAVDLACAQLVCLYHQSICFNKLTQNLETKLLPV